MGAVPNADSWFRVIRDQGPCVNFMRSPSCSGPTPDVCAADILPKVLGSIMFVLMPGSRAQRSIERVGECSIPCTLWDLGFKGLGV